MLYLEWYPPRAQQALTISPLFSSMGSSLCCTSHGMAGGCVGETEDKIYWDHKLQSYLYLLLKETTAANYPQNCTWILPHKVPLAHPKREQRSKHAYGHTYKADEQETRNWKWGHIECISQKIHGKSQLNWLLEFFPKLKTIVFWWNQWITAHEHLNSNLKEC